MVNSKAAALSLAGSLLLFAGNVDAFWRMPCRSRTGLARLDPLMDPDTIADHVHAIHGGGDFSMSVQAEDLVNSNCTSCEVTEDKSAYWTPSLHFMYPNGTTVIVEQVGGMLAYYLLYTDPNDATGNITAFPSGFQMISGDKRQRNFTLPVPDPPKSDWEELGQSTQADLAQKALGFNCLNYAAAPEGSLYRHFLPDKAYLDANCLDGIRLELMFPSCWNGKDVDSSDHKSHVAFPDLVMTGTCPEGFLTKVPSLFYETIWNTYEFVGVDGEFLLSYGDPTGYGYHGDFMMGWDPDFLQEAITTCTNASGEIQDCPLFNIQTDEEAALCTIAVPEDIADDNPAGPRDGLAIDVPIQSGPAYATTYAVVLADAETAMSYSSAATTSAVVPTLTYKSATAIISDNYGTVSATDDINSSSLSATNVLASSIIAQTAVLSSPITASPTTSSTATTISTASPSSSSTAAASTASPATSSSTSAVITAAPESGSSSSYTVLSTSTFTRDNEVIEMVVELVEVTVTATETISAMKHRRHLNEHKRGKY